MRVLTAHAAERPQKWPLCGWIVAAGLTLFTGWGGPTAGAETVAAEDVLLLDVPYLPQPPDLCGGAAAAMVQRYWGAEAVYAESYRGLVDEDLAGITTAKLAEALRAQGWRALPLRASRDVVRRELSMGRPLIALLGAERGPLHYVVVAGWTGEGLVIHDPSLGPWRFVNADEVFASWKTTGFWALLVLPPPSSSPKEVIVGGMKSSLEARSVRLTSAPSLCRQLVEQAVALGDDMGEVYERLASAARLCPADALVERELAALRFREGNWSDAATHAERAVRFDGHDGHAWSILGASRFLSGDPGGALKAWNAIGQPEIDRVEIRGLSRTRQDVVYRQLGLTPGTKLTAGALETAARRARELPTVDRARVSFAPLGGGRAKVVVHVTEGELLRSKGLFLARASVDAAVDRSARVDWNSPVHGGEVLDVRARFWRSRPALSVTLSAPRLLGLPGVGTLSGYVEKQGYTLSGPGAAQTEERRGARVDVGDWVSPTTRVTLGVGFEDWRGKDRWILGTGAVDQRLFADRVSLRAELSQWFSTGASEGFGEQSASVLARRSWGSEWTLGGRFDMRRVSSTAPFGVWPGAGTGRTRPFLLRGYPLLANGVISGDAFAPALLHASIESERVAWRGGLARIGVAAFYDWARTVGRVDAAPRTFHSVGLGARIHVGEDVLRLDGAVRPGGGLTVSAGWVESW